MWQDRLRRCSPAALSLLLAPMLVGCGEPPAPVHETPQPRPASTAPRFEQVVEPFRRWVLDQKAADQQPFYSRVEVLPVTQTVLPYGVGVNQQEPRLPVIVTTGPGWAKLTSGERHMAVARAFKEIEDGLHRAEQGAGVRATLTLQSPRGMLLAWINDTVSEPEFIHGDVD